MPTRRPTRQQVAVGEMLDELDDFTSAQDLHARLRAQGETVGLATVYRTLQTMAAEGTLDVLRTDDGEAIYRSCSTNHHHHLVCRSCGRTIEVEGAAVEKWTESVSRQYGFTAVTHHVEIFGVCGSCRDRMEAGAQA